jgi:hypothetical protein
MRRTLLFALLVLAAVPLRAQDTAPASDRAAVEAAVLDYVEGFYLGDTTRLQRSVSPDVHKIGYYRPAGGEYRLSRMPWPEFIQYANRVRTSGRLAPASAPREIQVFDVLDRTASAKLTAAWGTDYLLLAKTDGRWMVTHVLWQSPPPRPAVPAPED